MKMYSYEIGTTDDDCAADIMQHMRFIDEYATLNDVIRYVRATSGDPDASIMATLVNNEFDDLPSNYTTFVPVDTNGQVLEVMGIILLIIVLD